MRRILAMIMAMLMMLSLCACGAAEEAPAAAPAAPAEEAVAEVITGVEDGKYVCTSYGRKFYVDISAAEGEITYEQVVFE